MTVEQRVFDFQHLAAVFAKNYGPYEWKRDALGFDLYEIGPWITRVQAARSDLEYYEIASEYVASLRDSHSQYSVPSLFLADARLNVDVYDGRLLIDFVDRSVYPETLFPLSIGDEVVSVDGFPAAAWVQSFARFIGEANDRSRARQAATLLFFRPQRVVPRAFQIGEKSVVVVRRPTGQLLAFEAAWQKTNAAIQEAGTVPSPRGRIFAAAEGGGEIIEDLPFLRRLQTRSVHRHSRVLGDGQRNPYFNLPDGFLTRLGRLPGDFHYSGTYDSGGKRLGYLRFPNFSPPSNAAAVRELSAEIAFFEANTDGLVVDITRNAGGGCYSVTALQYLIPYPFVLPGDEMRATLEAVYFADLDLQAAKDAGAPPWTVALLEQILLQLRTALAENRGRTGPLPFCGSRFEHEPAAAASGRVLAYTKPLIVLTDEFTTSWGDIFASVMQDSARAPLVGFRTNGAGGSIDEGEAGFFSEATTTFSVTNAVRPRTMSVPGLPPSPYIENIGVHPDVLLDYMTRDNLMSGGRLFVDAFTRTLLAHVGVPQPAQIHSLGRFSSLSLCPVGQAAGLRRPARPPLVASQPASSLRRYSTLAQPAGRTQ
jgi:hypothetical protein